MSDFTSSRGGGALLILPRFVFCVKYLKAAETVFGVVGFKCLDFCSILSLL